MEETVDAGRTRTSMGRQDAALPLSQGLSAGSVIGGYVVLRHLGAGAMGEVHTAYHAGLDRVVALKVTRSREDTLREAQALARLAHPNVVHVYEVGEADGVVYVAMELVEGEPLDRWQRAPGRRLAELLDAYGQAARGLRAAHQAGLVHRDFKPANAVVGGDGRVRVLDFGLARGVDGAGEAGPAARAPVELAQTSGVVAGTPAYMAPEQFAGQTVDARADVFAFSVALWEALHGERPFAGATVEEVAAAVRSGRRRAARARGDLPGGLLAALERGLAVSPDARWPDLDPLIRALDVDPAADPSVAGRERRIATAVIGAFALLVSAPAMLAWEQLAELDRRVLLAGVAVGGALTVAATALALRRTLLRNTFHRRVVLLVVALAGMLAVQRTVGVALELSSPTIAVDGGLMVIGMLIVGAITFARWLLAPAAVVAAALIAWALAPAIYPVAMAVVGPLFLLVFSLLWRREARRGSSPDRGASWRRSSPS